MLSIFTRLWTDPIYLGGVLISGLPFIATYWLGWSAEQITLALPLLVALTGATQAVKTKTRTGDGTGTIIDSQSKTF